MALPARRRILLSAPAATGAAIAPQPLLTAVQEALAAFTKGARQHDDVTLVVVERE